MPATTYGQYRDYWWCQYDDDIVFKAANEVVNDICNELGVSINTMLVLSKYSISHDSVQATFTTEDNREHNATVKIYTVGNIKEIVLYRQEKLGCSALFHKMDKQTVRAVLDFCYHYVFEHGFEPDGVKVDSIVIPEHLYPVVQNIYFERVKPLRIPAFCQDVEKNGSTSTIDRKIRVGCISKRT